MTVWKVLQVRRIAYWCAAVALVSLWSAGAQAAEIGDVIASVTRIQGVATAGSGQEETALSLGATVRFGETLHTGAGARLRLSLLDGTALTLGERATLTLDAFVYDPEHDRQELGMAVSGAFRFVSGAISKARPEAVTVRTPLATIGIRGTDFWGGPIDGRSGVLLIDGTVTVETAGGAVVLDKPNAGTMLDDDPAKAPGAPVDWAAAKVARAVATVTFDE